jgi:hypothetical protein
MLGNLFGRAADRSVVPEEAVARGAALYCHWLLSGGGPEGATFRVTNVSSHSLGVEGIDLETRRGSNVVLIPRNTPLPASATKEFVTDAPGQRSIVVQVLEGESPQPAQCARIGRAAIRALPEGLPKGAPVQVTFEYGANGRLCVRAVVPGRAESTLLELQRDRPQRPAAIVPQAPPEGTSPDAPAPAAEPQSDWDWLAALGVAPAGGAWPASTTEESEPDVAAPATQDDGSYPLAAAPPPDDSSPYAAATDLAEGHLSESAISPGPQRSDFARRNQPRIARRLLSLAGIIAFGLLGLGAAALVARLLGR